MKKILKKLIPKKILNLRHLFFAWYGAVKYSHPSEELLVIGITGTSGKSSTVFLLRQLLEAAGYRVGSLSTIDFYIAGENKLNDQKMTMLGKMQIQKYLREMVDKKCDIAIVEITSEGRVQHRHKYINYDIMVLTNLYPEHIRSHGSFEKYKQAKIDIFKYAATYRKATKNARALEFPQLENKNTGAIKKIAYVNSDHEEVDILEEFCRFSFDKIYEFFAYIDASATNKTTWEVDEKFYLSEAYDMGNEFIFTHDIHNNHNELNKSIAGGILRILGIDTKDIETYMSSVDNPPGRVEYISEAEKYGFKVIVDYAFEPVALSALYRSIKNQSIHNIIHVSGNTGGGRDKPYAKAKVIAKHADIVIITNEDPYDDNPMDIINEMADIFVQEGKVDNKTLFRILNRRDGIQKAIEIAQKGDIILVTGKGSEQKMCVAGGKMIDWDDRQIVRELLTSKI